MNHRGRLFGLPQVMKKHSVVTILLVLTNSKRELNEEKKKSLNTPLF